MKRKFLFRSALAWALLLCMLVGLMPVNVFATEGEEETKAATKAATSYVAQIDALPTPYNVAISPTTNKYTEVFVNNGLGYYYVVNKESSTVGHLLSMSEQNVDQYIPSTDVTISGNTLTDPNPNNAIYIKATADYRGLFYPYKGNTLTLTRESGNDAYLLTVRGLLADNKMGGRVSNGLWVFPIFGTGAVGDDNDAWFTLTYDATKDAFAFVYHGKDHLSFLSTQTMQLYRVYTQGIELYKAMKAVRGYADGNADGRYPDDLYTTFSNYLKSCIDAYTANNTATEDEAGLKTTLDDMADQLFAYANDLSANVTDLDSYIDIPIEILDFRADGMLMEWDRATNPLWNFRGQSGQTGASQHFVKFPPGENQTVYTGLTESKLIDGQMIYTEKVVGYVAGLLSKKYATDWSTNTKIPGYNNISYEKMSDLTEMGNFAETIGKTDTEKNGGYLDWSEVTSYYDMAYYILNNLWRPVESDDYMDTAKKVGYNMVVPERKRMRLFKDEETGYYTIDAANRLIYDGYYISNSSEQYPTDAMYGDPFFRPIDNMGFESPENLTLLGGDTDQGAYLTRYQHESEDMNYHFSVHAEGSFVYYRDQNLYFQFIGDDDVYFFIDGKIAMDLGGSHGALGDELYLNDIAEEFGMVDGGVYSFDMFYIERHTTASNLKFSTNIKIVETETMTTKGMYLESSNGMSKVDSTTGMGEELADNALLRDGDIVAYSFNIANSRNIPVYNLSFDDTTLGATLSPDTVTLCDTALTGGVSTDISDIKVYYRTLEEDGTFYNGYPTTKSCEEIRGLIDTANDQKKGLDTGNYMVSPGTVDNLTALLQLGIPANCQMIIYGFKRQAQASLPSYENTMSSLCYYNLEGTAQTEPGVEEIPIKGTASRTYKVTAEPPKSQKLELVLDYGKAVKIPTTTVGTNIQTDALTTVTGFAGLVTSGNHEQVLSYISSSNLKCASEGQTYAGKQGTFIRTAEGLDYQPTRFMDTIETVYLVFNIEATNSNHKYMLVELKLLPATFVYYETDFAQNIFKISDEQAWKTVENGTSAADRYQDQEFISTIPAEIDRRLETIGAGPAILNEHYGIRNGLSNYNNNIPLSFSHRGSFRTSSENSYLAVLESLKQGMDGVEIDLMITSDKVVVLSHDKTLSRTTGDNVTIADVTWNSIRDYPLEVGNGTGDTQDYLLTADEATLLNSTISKYAEHYGEAASSGGKHYTARLDDVLELIKKKAPNAILTFDKVNDDKDVFVYSYKAAYEAGMLKNAFFKLGQSAETLKTWANDAATACGITQAEVLSSMQMLWVIGVPTASTVNSLKSYRNSGINVVALEGSWGTALTAEQESVITNTVMPYCRENNIDFWPTVIGPRWAGQWDDDETTWAYYLEELGVDGLMTDRPEEFGAFMHYYNGASRATSELIQAEHFQSYNIGSAKFYMNEAADLNNNKLVNDMHNGDYLEYRNITFTGSENVLYATAKSLMGNGTLLFYVDSMQEENCFASISFDGSEYCVTRSATMHRTVSAGKHTVYVQAWGNEGVALISFDSYTFQKQSDDHFLFFDFNNTAEAQNYYKKAIYGSNYNFGIRDYWATYASDNSNDQVNKTNFSIDNEKGIAKVTVGDDFEGENNYCGPKFMTTKTYGVFPYRGQGANAPLKYVPSPNDYLVVRFKLENVIAGSDYAPMLFMEYHWNDAAGTDNIKYEDLKAEYSLTLDQWQTVAVPVSDTFKNAAEITSLGLRFTGILSPGATDKGSVIIDYIYVGPIQQGDHLLIDFEEKLGSYEDPVYGGMNYNSEARWTHRVNRTEAPVISDGAISITTTGKAGVLYYHLLMQDATLNYTPGDDDYCEVRFKISDGVIGDATKNTTVNIYFSPDLYGTAGCGGSNNSGAKYDLDAINNGDYYTLQIPMTSVYYRDAGIIRSITLMFNNLAKTMVGTITVDYIYLGPLNQAPSSNSEPLFFDFTDTVADRERYNSYTYGYYNFDQSGEGHWATYATAYGEATNMTNYVIDNNAGTATITVGDTAEGEKVYGPKFQTTKTYGVYPWNREDAHKQAPLHYTPTGKEYIQARFKIEGCENVGDVKFQLDYHYEPTSGSTYMKYAGLDKAFTYTDGEWLTVTYSLAGISSFQNVDEILSVGLRFTGIKSEDANNLGRVVIDYIYIGPEETLPTNNFVTYGYDSSYTDDSRLSNGSSLFVEGAGIPYIAKDSNGSPSHIDYAAAQAYTEASFTFVGTGFDIISRTNVNQGLVRAVILDSKGAIVKNVSVINKGESELYQIPVLSIEGLTHGKYTVKLFADKEFDFGNDGNADIFGGGMDRGSEFYFDAVRIYNPINTRATDTNSRYAYEVYQKHGEADPTITEVRDILIDANNFTAGSAANGVVYLDATAKEGTEFDNEDGKLEPKIAEYRAIGPNNEVYLTPGNAIAFKLEVEGPIPASIDIGAKSADGAEASMIVGISKTVPTTLPAGTYRKIQTATAQYYPMEILPSRWNTATANNTDTHWVYVTIYNYGATGILSITDIKYAYDFPNPEEPASRKMVRFVVDRQMLDIYANPCNHIWDQGEITTAPTCTAEGVKAYTCTVCGSSYTETVPALGHSYINGVCSCGQSEAKEPIQETSWKLNHSLNLASDISVNLVVPKALLEGFDMATVYVESTLETYEGNIKTGTKTIRVEPVDNGYFYYFTLDGLTAVQMNDKIFSVLYGTKNGQTYYSPVDEYSIATYAYAQLNKTGIVESLKTLCADLLRYGAKAQIFKSYRTDSLADANMTDAHKAYLSDIASVTFGNTNKVLNDLENAPISWAGKALDLESKVALKFVFNSANCEEDLSKLTLKVEYTDIHGAAKTLVLENPSLYNPDRMLYAFTLDALLAAELRAVVSVQIFAGDMPVSCTLQYSADTYGNNKTGNLLELCKALFAYSDSAKAFFAK